MKFLSRIILLLFVSFQFSSTVLSLMDFDKESEVAIGFLDENEDSSDEKETNKELKVEYIDAKWNDFVFFYDRNYGQNGQTVFIERIHHLFNTIYSAS